jgi:hypothetical protein
LAGSENEGQWRSALDLYAKLEARETIFWARYRNRLAATLDSEIPQVTAVPVKPKHLKLMQPLLEDQARIIAREIEDGSLSPASILSRSVKRASNVFPRLPGLRWEEVTIDFTSNDSVKIAARGRSKSFRFAEIGFSDLAGVGKPDLQWELLQYIARHNGMLSWSDKAGARVRDGAKAKIKVIRRRLKAVMHIDADPFEPYRKVKAYMPKFTIIDSFSSQHRAEKDAPIEA